MQENRPVDDTTHQISASQGSTTKINAQISLQRHRNKYQVQISALFTPIVMFTAQNDTTRSDQEQQTTFFSWSNLQINKQTLTTFHSHQ